MQGKGLIRFFAILLAIVCVFQYFLMWQTSKIEDKADEYAIENAIGEDGSIERILSQKKKRSEYLDKISEDTVFQIPLVANYGYNDLKNATLGLGLDLKGGMSATLKVDLRDLIVKLANGSKNELFVQALDNADAAESSSQSDYVTLFADEYQKLDNGKKMSKVFGVNPSMRSLVNAESTDAEVIAVLREKANETVVLTYEMLKERIDKLGVVQPNITLDENRDLILVEMPGIENPERARKFLAKSAELGFWDAYRISDLGIEAGFDQLQRHVLNAQILDGTVIEKTQKIEYKYDEATGEKIDSSYVDSNENDDPLSKLLDVNSGVQQRHTPAALGFADRKNLEAVSELLKRDEVKANFPNDIQFVWSADPEKIYKSQDEYENKYILYGLKKGSKDAKAPVQGDVITESSSSPDPDNGQMQVSLTMNSKGAKQWGELTTYAANNGDRQVAIVLDDEVVSAPRCAVPITSGRTSISGNFTVQEATDLSKILSVGKLPAKIRIIQESTVGPTLGQENIQNSIGAILWGLGLLLAFMAFYYGGAGIVSILALLLNVFFIFGALANFGTVLTVPGIAGIILTIGMAVDANVIIFERIREELRSGKSMLTSIQDGFKHSYSAIIDANVTTILVAMVLARFGLGPIKGFAVVLIIGVLLSLLTAVLIGKMIFDWWTIKKEKEISFWTPPVKTAFSNMNIDWIGKRKIAYVISGIFIFVGIGSITTSGLDYGVDFKGGYQYEIQFPESSSIVANDLREGLVAVFEGAPVVKAVDKINTFSITTDYLINEQGQEGNSNKVLSKLAEGISGITGVTVADSTLLQAVDVNSPMILSSVTVGPTIADDIKKSSLLAAILALILIFTYITIRFSKWQYSLGAVVALVHDTLIVLGVFSLLKNVMPFPLELDQAFIAAVLTVIGYSINDTVVVFDRIREYLGIYTSKTTDEVLNLAINSTFSRTIITSLTTMFVISMLLIFGGGNIKGFAFAIFIGIIVGTYSSIFVATPVLRDFTKDLRPKVNKGDKKTTFSKAISE